MVEVIASIAALAACSIAMLVGYLKFGPPDADYNIYFYLGRPLCNAVQSFRKPSPPAANEIVVFSRYNRGDLSPDGKAYFCYKIPAILRLEGDSNASDTLLALTEARIGTASDMDRTDLVMKRSEDGGETWGPLTVIHSLQKRRVVSGNAAVTQLRGSGRILVPFCINNAEVWITWSDDLGKTWEPARRINARTHVPLEAYAWIEKQDEVVLDTWAWVGIGPNKGIQLASGRVVVPGYHARGRSNAENCNSNGHILYAEEGIVLGATPWIGWKIGAGRVDNDLPCISEFDIQELQDNTVILVARADSPGKEGVTADGIAHKTPRPVAYSDDGGLSFRDYHWNYDLTQPLAQEIPGALLRLMHSDELIFSAPANTGWLRKDLSIWYSGDRGRTWQVVEKLRRGMSGQSGLTHLKPVNGEIAVGLLYELSVRDQIILEPDYTVFRRLNLEPSCPPVLR